LASPEAIFNAIKGVGNRLDSLDKESLKDLTKLVNIARKEVINRLANKPTEYQAWKYSQTKADLDRILDELDRTLKTKMTGYIQESWDLGIAQVDEPLKAAEIFGMIPDINVNMLTTFKDFSADLITNLTDEARKKIENAIKIGILAGDPIGRIAKQIGTNLEDRSIFKSIRTRAVTIGRTEINRIFNYSNDLRYVEAEKVVSDLAQMWVAAMDSRTRFSHRAADGQIAKHGEPFKVGSYEAQFPGDPSLPAKESVNCRCRIIPYHSDWNIDWSKHKIEIK
jgi:SPP1 gp7 family putative phage head morphogenesis protein